MPHNAGGRPPYKTTAGNHSMPKQPIHKPVSGHKPKPVSAGGKHKPKMSGY